MKIIFLKINKESKIYISISQSRMLVCEKKYLKQKPMNYENI